MPPRRGSCASFLGLVLEVHYLADELDVLLAAHDHTMLFLTFAARSCVLVLMGAAAHMALSAALLCM